jgi:hypothetical protein
MANRTHCPFTHSLCSECLLYRGRHHYLTFSRQDQGYTDRREEHDSVESKALKELLEPWRSKGTHGKNELKIGLKVTDMETGTTRICEFKETKTWDWNNPTILRLIDGLQVYSFDCLIEILNYKAEKGYKEVEIYEAPRFMLLGGG